MAKTVLIVDDARGLQKIYDEWLRAYPGEPLELIFAANGREALDRLAEHPLLDLIITDVKMPEMDGPTFLARIRRDYAAFNIPVILASTRAAQVVVHEGRAAELGITTYLLKPFGRDQLFAALDAIWSSRPAS